MSDVPDLSSDDEHFEENDWQEMDSVPVLVKCLFCPNEFQLVEESLAHCEKSHNFNLNTLKLKFNMDCYSYLKLINYIRTHKPDSKDIMTADKVLWEDDQYLKPVVENDEWLMYDFDAMSEIKISSKTYHANVENGLVTLSQIHFTELQRTIQKLTEQLNESEAYLQMAKEDIIKMQESMKSLVDGLEKAPADNMVNCVANVPPQYDEGYFHSYSHFGIHYDMLSDKVRTESYRDAILNNQDTIKDKVVLDLGCGTGILSMFSVTAGAKHVYAVDQSEVIYHAMDIVRENHFDKHITTIKGRLEDTKLENKVDIIVSEWMGYFLLFEGMLDSVIYAREHCLNRGGLLLPNRCNMSIVANGDVDTHKKLIEFWSDVYGYKMNSMKSEVVREASIDVVSSKNILSEPCNIQDIDLYTCSYEVMNFSTKFSLPITKDGVFTSIVGYFDTFFDLPNKVSFSTGPQCTPTHWKQTVFYFRQCIAVKQGDIIEGTITCNRETTNARALNVEINIFGRIHQFILS